VKILKIAFLIAAMLLVGYLAYYYATRPSVESITAMINKEVPPDSSFEAVRAFMHRHRIEQGAFVDSGPDTPTYLRNTLTAYINPNIRILWLTGGLTIRFWFSNDRKLDRFSVQEDWSGLP